MFHQVLGLAMVGASLFIFCKAYKRNQWKTDKMPKAEFSDRMNTSDFGDSSSYSILSGEKTRNSLSSTQYHGSERTNARAYFE